MCSRAVSSVIDYYNQAGRPVYACPMDLSKAFDIVSWCKLFPELLKREVSPLALRCLIYIYRNQTCNVKWANSMSEDFHVTNGEGQGAVSSPILFCIYIIDLIKQLRLTTLGCQIQGICLGIWVQADDIVLLAPSRNGLIQQLRLSTLGCQIQGIYLGIWVQADDIVLLAPSRNGLQEMSCICEKFTIQCKLKFSTNVNPSKSKTKCMIFYYSNINVNNVCPIFLNGVPLPYVEDFKHIGHICISICKFNAIKNYCKTGKVDFNCTFVESRV